MSAAVDTAVLALLRAALTGYTTDRVHDGEVKAADWDEKVINAPTPYVLHFGAADVPMSNRLVGNVSRGNDIRFNCVGSTREQAVFMADRAEAAVNRKRVLGRFVQLAERTSPRRDDTWSRPDGGPLYIVSLSFDRR